MPRARARYNGTWWAPSENGTGRRGTIQVTKSAMVSFFSLFFFFSFFFFFLKSRLREPEIPSLERTLHARARFCDRSISLNTRNALATGERGDTRKSFETIRFRNRFYLQMESVFSFPIILARVGVKVLQGCWQAWTRAALWTCDWQWVTGREVENDKLSLYLNCWILSLINQCYNKKIESLLLTIKNK